MNVEAKKGYISSSRDRILVISVVNYLLFYFTLLNLTL